MTGTGKDGSTTTISVSVVGATGKFGRAIISQAPPDIKISGAVCSDSNPAVGKTLREAGIQSSDTVIRGASQIEDAITGCDVALFVSKADADMANIPKALSKGKRIVVGTTGFTSTQTERLNSLLTKVPSVVASNFSIGANVLFQVTRLVSRFSPFYDYSVIEHHHKLKIDAPSGTAKTLAQILNNDHAFPVTVTDRTVKPKRIPGEVEMVSLRGGGTPGIHQLVLAGEHDMIRVEHLAFSRAAGASGALLACRWIASRNEPGIYSMQDVLDLRAA